jgi:hypothetical protein
MHALLVCITAEQQLSCALIILKVLFSTINPNLMLNNVFYTSDTEGELITLTD